MKVTQTFKSVKSDIKTPYQVCLFKEAKID